MALFAPPPPPRGAGGGGMKTAIFQGMTTLWGHYLNLRLTMKYISVLAIFFSGLFTAQTALSQDVAIGEAYTVGTTWWFIQQNSTVGRMIARDEIGGVHFVWTKGEDEQNNERHVYYNFIRDNGGDIAEQLNGNSRLVDNSDRAGYAALDLLRNDNTVVCACFFHIFGRAAMAIDFNWGLGAFSTIYLDGPDRQVPMVVKGTIDRNGRAHVLSGTHDMMGANFPLVIWHADPGDEFDDWDVGVPNVIEMTTGLTHCIKAARESEQVALTWHHNIVGVPAPEEWDGSAAYGMNNDLYLIESPDGEEWDLDNPLNITRTIEPDPHLNGAAAFGDTLRPFNDCDILYVGDVVHVVFTVRGFWGDPTGDFEPPVQRITTRESFIWHWDSETDTLTLVADGWYDNEGNPGSLLSNLSQPSLSADEDGALYCIFRQVTDDDLNPAGYCFGEVMLSISRDQGITWSEAVVMTGTNAGDPDEVEYVDECYPSIADRVDDNLHIYYQLVPETEGSPQEALPDECMMVYQRVPVGQLPDVDELELPREGFKYHNYPPVYVSRDHEGHRPDVHTLISAFPNPFNASVEISYMLSRDSDVYLRIIDLFGRSVYQYDFSKQTKGRHLHSINAQSLPTGIYIASVETIYDVAMMKLVCVK